MYHASKIVTATSLDTVWKVQDLERDMVEFLIFIKMEANYKTAFH